MEIEVELVGLGFVRLLGWRRHRSRVGLGVEMGQQGLDFLVALQNEYRVGAVAGQGWAQDEKVFGPVIAHQRLGNGLATGWSSGNLCVNRRPLGERMKLQRYSM